MKQQNTKSTYGGLRKQQSPQVEIVGPSHVKLIFCSNGSMHLEKIFSQNLLYSKYYRGPD